MLSYTAMFTTKNNIIDNKMKQNKNTKDSKDSKDSNNKESKESKESKDSVPVTRSQKRKLNDSEVVNNQDENVNKKYKKNDDDDGDGEGSDSDSETECDDEYIPESTTESEADESNTDSISESEYEFITKNNDQQKLDEKLNEKKELETIKENDDYEQYLEELAEEMGDNIYNTVKSKLTNDIEKNGNCDEVKIPIIILNNGPLCPQPEKGYNLRKNTNHYDIISPEEKKYIEETEKALWELNRHKIPPRHKILLSQMSLASKAKVIESMDRIETMNSYSSEYSKLSKWIDGIVQVPFGKYTKLPISLTSPNDEIISYLSNIEHVMDECIYGQQTAKEKILEFVGKWITNPNSTNEPLAFVGDKGTGKTTLAKEGVAKALGRPFYMISLGGESDASSFKGHDYTYEGSRCGKIVDILISTQCMNPVIFFDELDKLSTTHAGEEITGMLMHLTDTTQNDSFSDKYFSGINFDLSKAMFIFSYNDPEKLNPILRDRLTEIKFTPFKKKDKLIIARNFLIKRACENIGLKQENYILDEDTLSYLIEKYTDNEESGVRSVKRIIETLFLRINLFHLPQNLNISYKNMKIKTRDDKYVISPHIISELLKDIISCIPSYVFSMYC